MKPFSSWEPWQRSLVLIAGAVIGLSLFLSIFRLPIFGIFRESFWLSRRVEKPFTEITREEGRIILSRVVTLAEKIERSWLVKRIASNQEDPVFSWGVEHAVEGATLAQYALFGSNQPWLILLQNTDEIRATGGFMGSYAELSLDFDDFGQVEIRDIYDPDGRIFTSLESPPGQKEYLSAGKGLRLPDANWHPDFPTSAERISEFFEQIEGDPREYAGAIALNLSFIQDVLRVLGPIESAHFSEPLTAETLSSLLRQDRGEFFSGSRQKTQSLEQALGALRVRLEQASPEEQQQLASVFLGGLKRKDIQIYSRNAQIQAIFLDLGVAGQMELGGQNEIPVFLVESNVGVNKANRKVTRFLEVDEQGDEVVLTLEFINHHTLDERPTTEELANQDHDVAPHLGYINYQRVFIRPEDEISQVFWQGKPVTHVQERLVITAKEETWKEVGFLLKLPEASTGVLEMHLVPERGVADREIKILQQAGVRY